MEIRRAESGDLAGLLDLYTHLHDNPAPQIDRRVAHIWREILSDVRHHVMVGVLGGQIVSSCVLVIVPNLTHDQRPYALIENVVTHRQHRSKGYATSVLSAAKQMAEAAGCYKIMLMTGSKKESTLAFYERAGYRRHDKTAFVQWL